MGSALTARGSTRRWRRLRLWVLNRDGWLCQARGTVPAEWGSWASIYAGEDWPRIGGRPAVCGRYADHADHVDGRAGGGDDDVSNLRATCPDHNLSKGARPEGSDGLLTPSAPTKQHRWEW